MNYLIHHTGHLTIVLLMVGLALRYIISRRRFNRRGIAALQFYSSYNRAMLTTIIERIIMFVATLMIIAAIILYLRT